MRQLRRGWATCIPSQGLGLVSAPLLVPASCECTPWRPYMMAPAAGSLLHRWETDLLAPGSQLGLAELWLLHMLGE